MRDNEVTENVSYEIEIGANTIKCLLAEEGVKMRDVDLYVLLIGLEVEI